MSIESRGPQFERETPPPAVEVSQTEKNLNELVPILAHGLVRRIEQKGFSGKVRVSSMAGEDWGVAKSPDNTTDIPNIIIYPRECLSGDKKVVNAQLRHEIGNLNYPIEGDLNDLREWCEQNNISPVLLTSLAESVQEASVNYLEMRNSHSDSPEENFRALYEQEINTAQIADNISEASPYKQAVDLSLLYSLSQVGLIPEGQFEQALSNVHQSVQDAFDKKTQSVLNQAVKMSVPKKKIQLIKEYVWPKFSKLVALSPADDLEAVKKKKTEKQQDKLNQRDDGESLQVRQAKIEEMKKQLEEMKSQMQKSEQKSKPSSKKEKTEKLKTTKSPEKERPSQKDISPAEKNEQEDIKKQLEESLNERLQDLKEQISELQKAPQPTPEAEPKSMEDIAEQADKMQSQTEQSMQELQERLSSEDFEKMQELMDELKDLEDVAKQVSETEMPEEEIEEEDEPMTYNIKEYGINENELGKEQLELLDKTRDFAKETSKTYRKVMRLLMSAYQKTNPNFTPKMVDKLKQRGYDLPQFSIYGAESGGKFLSKEEELGIENIENDNFLLNFNLPKPFGRFWYKGGSGSKSQPVREGEIEWGDFYRKSMPAIWSATDRAVMSGLYLDRLNSFGEHDYKKYYYLWEALKYELPDYESEQDKETDQSEQEETREKSEQVQEEQQGDGSGQGQQQESEEEQGQDKGSESAESQGGQEGSGAESGAGAGAEGGGEQGGFSPEQMKEFLDQMKQMVEDAKKEAEQSGGLSSETQEAINQLMEQFSQMQGGLDSGQSPQELSEQMSGAMQGMSDAMENMEGEMQGDGQGQRGVESQEEISEVKSSGGQADDSGFEKSQIEESSSEESSSERGGAGNEIEGEGITFKKPSEKLIEELRNSESVIGSKFSQRDDEGNFIEKDLTGELPQLSEEQLASIEKRQTEQIQNLEELKRQHQAKVEAMYKEMSGLSGEALRLYTEYMESMKDLTDDLTDFFIEKFDLEREYVYERNQRRGARLQRGYVKNIVGRKDGKTVIHPRSFEKKRPPELPQFVWSIIIDNTGSVGGMIEDEKKLAISLIEVTKRLDIPFEIAIYTEGGYMFLKDFEQEAYGDDLEKCVMLQATIGNQQDTDLLNATYNSQMRFADKFRRSNNFIFFLTDGLACSADSLNAMIKKFKKDTAILGVGLAQGAETIEKEFGKNSIKVPDSKQLSQKFTRKLEEIIDQTFD
ncbi:hypothetical protein CL634_09850 [bacterium]|nr:hypothetical protein [bacterium]